jgi:hypothetical protein
VEIANDLKKYRHDPDDDGGTTELFLDAIFAALIKRTKAVSPHFLHKHTSKARALSPWRIRPLADRLTVIRHGESVLRRIGYQA